MLTSVEKIMFVRVTTTPNSPRKSIKIVENIRVGDKIRQKIISHIGIAQNADMEKQLIAIAQAHIDKLESDINIQPELFSDLPKIKRGRKTKKELKDILPTNQVTLDDIVEDKRIIEGVDDIAGAAYDMLGYDKLLLRGSSKLLKDLVLARLVHPFSKHKLHRVLFEQYDKQYDLNQIYRLMDQIHPKIDKIKQITCRNTQSLMPSADVILFDVTTLHFESVDTGVLRQAPAKVPIISNTCLTH